MSSFNSVSLQRVKNAPITTNSVIEKCPQEILDTILAEFEHSSTVHQYVQTLYTLSQTSKTVQGRLLYTLNKAKQYIVTFDESTMKNLLDDIKQHGVTTRAW